MLSCQQAELGQRAVPLFLCDDGSKLGICDQPSASQTKPSNLWSRQGFSHPADGPALAYWRIDTRLTETSGNRVHAATLKDLADPETQEPCLDMVDLGPAVSYAPVAEYRLR